MAVTRPRVTIDPITFEVLRNALVSVVDQMEAMLEKVAFSLVVNEARDLSNSLCAANGDLVAAGEVDLPAHVGTIPYMMRGILSCLGEDGVAELQDGDIIVMNDPFLGGSHNMDVRMVMPVFSGEELVAWVATSVHWSDIGGPVPGGFNPRARNTFEEGLVITPIHIARRGVVDENLVRLLLRNVRIPKALRGDLIAQIEACRTGKAGVEALLGKYGHDVFVSAVEESIERSEQMIRAEVAKLPDGSWEWEDFIDYDPNGDPDVPLRVHLRMTIRGDELTYDFSRSHPQGEHGAQGPPSMAWGAAAVATKSLFPHVPVNQGIDNAVNVLFRPGTVVAAEFPAAVSGAFATVYDQVMSCVYGCFMQVAPHLAMACPFNSVNVTISGVNTATDEEYVSYVWVEGGYGARPGKRDNHTAISYYGSGTRNQPSEHLDRVFPFRNLRYEFVPDTEGAGRHRGGFGAVRSIGLTNTARTVVSTLGCRGKYPPWGFGGGSPGQTNRIVYAEGTPEEAQIGVLTSQFPVAGERTLSLYQSGGGGWGDPHERPPEWVLEDVLDELVSLQRARGVYGVAIDVLDADALDLRIDWEATQELRRREAPRD
jgi:N-methylhydantoinase B